MLTCKTCDSSSFTATFDVVVSVSGRVQSIGPIQDKLPPEVASAYASLYAIKVGTPTVFSRLRWQDAKHVECRRCGGSDFFDTSACPECSSEIDEDQVVFCHNSKRVMCIHCMNSSWCSTCEERGCKFYGEPHKVFRKVRDRIEKKPSIQRVPRPHELEEDALPSIPMATVRESRQEVRSFPLTPYPASPVDSAPTDDDGGSF